MRLRAPNRDGRLAKSVGKSVMNGERIIITHL